MEEVGEAMGGGAGLVFPGGRIAPVHRFCFLCFCMWLFFILILQIVVVLMDLMVLMVWSKKFEQSSDAYQVSQGRTMWQLKPLKIIPSYRFFTFSIVSEIQTHLVVSWSSCDSPPAGFSWRDKLRYKRPWPLSCIISFIEICRNCLYYRWKLIV